MGYMEMTRMGLVPLGSGVLAEEDLADTAAVHGEFVNAGPHNVIITAIRAVLTEAVVATSTAPVVTVKKRPTPGSSGSESTIDTLTFPNTTTIGKVMWARVPTRVSIAPGESLCFDHTTQCVGGSVAGKCIYDWDAELDKEIEANQSNMVESA